MYVYIVIILVAKIDKLAADQVLREEAVGAQWMDRHTDEQSNLLRCRLAQKKKKKPRKTSRDKKKHVAIGNITYRGGFKRPMQTKRYTDRQTDR